MGRDRRWDFLYERQKEPVKDWLLARAAEALAEELSGWPPPFEEAVPGELLARWASGLGGAAPRAEVIRFALEVARLELARELERIDRLMDGAAPRRWRTAAEAAAGHLVTRFVTERCLELQEQASGARLTRADLVRLVELVEGRVEREAGG